MAKLSTDELIDAFKELTLIELSEFVSQFEDVFGVTAAAPVAVAAAPAAGGGDAGAAAGAEPAPECRATHLPPSPRFLAVRRECPKRARPSPALERKTYRGDFDSNMTRRAAGSTMLHERRRKRWANSST